LVGTGFLAGAALVAWLVAVALDRKPPPNVLIITIDTLRADVLGEDMPALLELAKRGVRFTRARTPCPLTLPAHASLLSGVDPRVHGMRTNTSVPLPGAAQRPFPMLAEELKSAGYATAAFVASAVLHPRFKLGAGFDQYRHPVLQGREEVLFLSLTAEQQVARLKAWMEARPKDRPYFVWVHLWDPHAPYDEYAGDERRAGTSRGQDDARTLYRGEVRRADWAVERMLQLIDPGSTVVVVTSDHGESLGEHDEKTHGHLCYSATMDVPLILAGPGVPNGKTESRVCSLTDVAPTLRRLCGLAAGSGPDLLSLPDRRTVVGESLYSFALYRWAQQVVAFDGTHTLVDGGPRLELFDRAADPGETRPVEDPEVASRLDEAITRYKAGEGARRPGAAFAVPATPYGAVNSPAHFLPPKANRTLLPVRPRLQRTERLMNRLNVAIALGARPDVESALEDLDDLERDDTQNPAFALARGRALLLVLGRPKQAERAFETAIARGYPRAALQGLLKRARGR